MLLKVYQIQKEYIRPSKQGNPHTYYRRHKVALLKCDCCGVEFERRISQMDPRRLTKDHSHVCPNCPAKKFAQNKGIENKHFWNITVDYDIDLDSV